LTRLITIPIGKSPFNDLLPQRFFHDTLPVSL
jgi:hypothetical protein